ncbi:MAG: hypothetical protein ACFFGZ_19200 [Candidatus Thorarchaeota archaeon]
MALASNSHAKILDHWISVAQSKPWIHSTNSQDLWTGIRQNKPADWVDDKFSFLGFQFNFTNQRCWDKLRSIPVRNAYPLLRILSYVVESLEVQPVPARFKWIRLAHFPGLRARSCALSDWPEVTAILKGMVAPRKIDFSAVVNQPPLTQAWSIQDVFQHPIAFWERALGQIEASLIEEGPGDMIWEICFVPNLIVRITFQEPDLEDDFPGTATAFYSGGSIFLLPVEIAETIPTLVVGRCLQAAEFRKD